MGHGVSHTGKRLNARCHYQGLEDIQDAVHLCLSGIWYQAKSDHKQAVLLRRFGQESNILSLGLFQSSIFCDCMVASAITRINLDAKGPESQSMSDVDPWGYEVWSKCDSYVSTNGIEKGRNCLALRSFV